MGFDSGAGRGASPVEDPGKRVGEVAAELAVGEVLHDEPDAPVCQRLVHVLGRPQRIPEVVQRVEHGDQGVAVPREVLGTGHLEAHVACAQTKEKLRNPVQQLQRRYYLIWISENAKCSTCVRLGLRRFKLGAKLFATQREPKPSVLP